MGCCSSAPKFDIITERTLQELGLSKAETKKLVKLFGKVDADGNGVIQADEFFDFFDLQPSLVNKLVFSCYDMEENGEMTFIQFVCTLWSFFTLRPEEVGVFVFFVFDLKKTGRMSFSQVPHVVKQLHRKHYDESPPLRALVDKMVQGPSGKGRGKGSPLTAEAFSAWSGANPEVCRPLVGKQKDMMDKAFKTSFWKRIALKKMKAERLQKVNHVYEFMKRLGGRDVFAKRKLSIEEVAEQEKKEEIAEKVAIVAADKAEKVLKYKKKNSKPIVETKEGHQVSYFDVDDIDQLMDGYAVSRDEMKGMSSDKQEVVKKKSGKSKKGAKGNKNKKIAPSDNDFGSLTTKALPPLVLKALQKGQISSAVIAPMDNSRISDAARQKVQQERANEMSPEEKKRVFSVKAGRLNKKMSNEYDLFH